MLTASPARGSAFNADPPLTGDGEFTIDLRVTATAPAGAVGRVDSDDGCSSTCELSNRVTESADPS